MIVIAIMIVTITVMIIIATNSRSERYTSYTYIRTYYYGLTFIVDPINLRNLFDRDRYPLCDYNTPRIRSNR